MFERIVSPQLVKNLSDQDVAFVVVTQLSTINYLRPTERLQPLPDRRYTDNTSLWKDILERRLRANVVLTLEHFLLSEWFPRSPGLFHTQNAETARKAAMHFIESQPHQPDLDDVDDADRERRYETPGAALVSPEFTYIFNPYGKMNMLGGGIGSIRLRDKQIQFGRVWFMSASSTRVAHEGFPVAVPDEYYQRHADVISTKGFLPCTLVGRLQFLPEDLVKVYRGYTGVPQLYLLVEQIRPGEFPEDTESQPFRVSIPITFESRYEGYPRMYAAYVTFYPSKQGSLERRVEWLEKSYVTGLYRGRVVTDFDEQEVHFTNAVFTLQRVMKGEIDKDQLNQLEGFRDVIHVTVEKVEEFIMEKKEVRSIIVGPGAHIDAPVVIADTIQDSFKTLGDSRIDQEVKRVLEQLVREVNEVNKNVPREKAKSAEVMARDVGTLVKEVTSAEPRRKWYEVSLEGIKEAASNIGEVAKPVIEVVKRLVPLLMGEA